MAAINYLFRPFGAFGVTTSQRTGDTWNGGTAGIAPDRCLLWDQDLDEFYVGNGTPENTPTSGTAGAVLIGPEVFRGGNYGFGRAIISPTGLSGTQHNYNPTGLATATVLRITPNGANMAITGIESQTGAIIDGRILVIENISTSFDINLVNEVSAGSDADNKILFTNTANETLAIKPNGSFTLWYDNTSQRWRPFTNTRPTKHFHSNASDGGKLNQHESWHIAAPTNGQKRYLFWTPVAITIQESTAWRTAGTNVIYNIRHATTYDSGSPISVFTSDITLSSTSGSTNNSGFNDNTIPAGSHVWVVAVTVNGGVTDFGGSIDYTQDFV